MVDDVAVNHIRTVTVFALVLVMPCASCATRSTSFCGYMRKLYPVTVSGSVPHYSTFEPARPPKNLVATVGRNTILDARRLLPVWTDALRVAPRQVKPAVQAEVKNYARLAAFNPDARSDQEQAVDTVTRAEPDQTRLDQDSALFRYIYSTCHASV